jgi:DNA-binding transcriptional LysR family regulator
VALGWLSLIKPLIARKALVQVTATEIVAPRSFYVTWRADRQLTREAEILRDWLVAQAA